MGDWEQYSLHQAQGVEFRAFEKPYLTARDGDNRRITQYDEYHTFLMWSAPEVLTRTQVGVIVVTAPRRPADVYSYGVIAFETFTDMEPYEGVLHSMDKKHSRSPIQILGDIKVRNRARRCEPTCVGSSRKCFGFAIGSGGT